MQNIDLKNKQESIRTKTFVLMLEMIVIFGAPAFVAALLGKQIDLYYNSGKVGTFITLGCAFLFSWFLVIRKYIKLNRELRDINQKIYDSKISQ